MLHEKYMSLKKSYSDQEMVGLKNMLLLLMMMLLSLLLLLLLLSSSSLLLLLSSSLLLLLLLSSCHDSTKSRTFYVRFQKVPPKIIRQTLTQRISCFKLFYAVTLVLSCLNEMSM